MNLEQHFKVDPAWEREDYDEVNDLIQARTQRELRTAWIPSVTGRPT